MSKTTVIYKDIAPGADETAVFHSEYETDFSDIDTLRQENDQLFIASLERNAWILNKKFKIYKGETLPFWSEALSDENGVFAEPIIIEITMPDQYSTVGMTFQFDDTPGAFASDVNIKWYQQDELKAEGDFFPNDNLYFCVKRAESWDRIVITFYGTHLPYSRLKLRQIIFGVIRKFGMDEIRNARITNQTSHISLEVPISTMNWTLESKEDIDYMFQFKQPVEAWNDDFMIGVYYIDTSRRTSASTYTLRCQDAFGVMDEDEFEGGVYKDYSAKQLLLDILDGDFEVEFADDVEDMNLTGALETMKKRAALQQVLFAWGVCAATDGGYAIRVLNLKDVPLDIGIDRAYTGVAVETSSIVTAVEVTAHQYVQDQYGGIEIDGKFYRDEKTVYTVSNRDMTANDKKNVLKIEGASFVSNDIGQAVAQRVFDFYTKRNTAEAKIVWHGELLGDCVTLPTSWGETNSGNIAMMNYTLSNTVAVDCEVIA